MENAKTKILTLLGFAQKAGKLISGANTVENIIGRNECKLAIIASDSSPKYVKNLITKCEYLDQRYIVFSTKEELGKAIGKSQRALLVVKDKNIADEIFNIFKKTEAL